MGVGKANGRKVVISRAETWDESREPNSGRAVGGDYEDEGRGTRF